MTTKNRKQVPFLELQRRAIALCKDLNEVYERHGVSWVYGQPKECWCDFYFDENGKEFPYTIAINYDRKCSYNERPFRISVRHQQYLDYPKPKDETK